MIFAVGIAAVRLRIVDTAAVDCGGGLRAADQAVGVVQACKLAAVCVVETDDAAAVCDGLHNAV